MKRTSIPGAELMASRKFQNIVELREWLEGAGIDLSIWGRGRAKGIVDLWSEYERGESSFHDDPPYREVEVVQIAIRRGNALLIEVEQELADGRRRARLRPPSEKLKQGEEPRAAVMRCLDEELGLTKSEVSVTGTSQRAEQLIDSPSYPGLPTRYLFHIFEAEAAGLPDEDFFRDNTAFDDPVRRHHWGWRLPE